MAISTQTVPNVILYETLNSFQETLIYSIKVSWAISFNVLVIRTFLMATSWPLNFSIIKLG